MAADSKRVKSKPTTTKHWLYKFWRHHPIVQSYCCNGDTEVYTEYLNTLLKFDTTTFGKYVDALSSRIAIELRKELDSLCTGSLSDSFCPLKEILELVDKAPSSLSSWTTEHKNAYLINFFLLKRKHHPLHFSDIDLTPEQEHTIMMDMTDYILRAYEQNEIAELEILVDYFPSDGQYKQDELCHNDNLCIFLKIVEAVRKYIHAVNLYENPPRIGGRIRRVVPTGVDFIAFLEHTQLDRITKLGSNQQQLSRKIADELKKDLTNSFTSLGTYFEEVNRFNNRIIQADISDETLQNYISQLDKLLLKVTAAVEGIMDDAKEIVGSNVAGKAALLLIKIIGALNPIERLTGGDPTTAVDIAEAAAELANAAAGLDKLLRTIKAAEDLYQKAKVVAEGFDENQEYLNNVKTIVMKNSGADFEQAKKDFLESYGSYNPSVTRPQIAELGSYWEAVITSACEEIYDTSGAVSAIGKSSALEDCMKAEIDVAKMMELYAEIYDFQFDLMDSLAASMRAQNAIEAADKLKQEFDSVSELNPNSDTTITTLVMIGSLNYVAYRANVLQAVILYCNILEYKDNFIIKENVCKGPRTSIASLVLFKPRPCTVEVQKFFHDIPTNSSGPGDEAYMDINKLYSGLPVYFKIPNSQWLVDRNWIFTSQKSYAIYVKQFEVYLPTASDRNCNVLVRAMPLMNEKLPGGTVYDIEPQRSLQFDYTEGPTAKANCRGLTSDLHPYTTCMGSSSNTICHNTGEVIREVYPSIYARWNISMEGYENTVPPKPANGDFTLKVGLRLCMLSPDHVMVAASVGDEEESYPQQMVVDQAESTCCENGQYRSGSYASGGECVDCPPESKATLAGYYCGKN